MLFQVFHKTSVSLQEQCYSYSWATYQDCSCSKRIETTKCTNYEPHSREKMVKVIWQIYNKSITTTKTFIFHTHIPSAQILTCITEQGIKRGTNVPQVHPLCGREGDRAEVCSPQVLITGSALPVTSLSSGTFSQVCNEVMTKDL